MTTLCLYHDNCADGFGAAYAVYRWFNSSDSQSRTDIQFKAVQYGNEIPDVSGLNVLIVDFSFPRSTLLEMKERANNLVVIDHHKTAQAELAGLDFCVFDLDKSGAVLTWKYLFPNEPMPELFAYLQDRDLWQWKLPQSKEVSAALRSHEQSFETWDGFMGSDGINALKVQGIAILRYQSQQIKIVLSGPIDKIEIGGYLVPCVNCTHLISELGNELAQGNPFAALYFDTGDGKRVFSLRSTNEGIDVSEIAKMYGGGGHRNAAGFTVPRPEILS